MKPYYQDELITIYNAPCEKGIKKSDVIIWDAPNLNPNCLNYEFKTMFIFSGLEQLLEYMLIWYPKLSVPLIWHRTIVSRESVLAYPPRHNELWIDYILMVGHIQAPHLPIYSVSPAAEKVHKWERPVDLLMDLLNFTTGDILDPFLGSGSTCVAAMRLGRKCIGYEIEKEYCEIAAERCRNEGSH